MTFPTKIKYFFLLTFYCARFQVLIDICSKKEPKTNKILSTFKQCSNQYRCFVPFQVNFFFIVALYLHGNWFRPKHQKISWRNSTSHSTKSNQNIFWWIGWKLELHTYYVLINGKANNEYDILETIINKYKI